VPNNSTNHWGRTEKSCKFSKTDSSASLNVMSSDFMTDIPKYFYGCHGQDSKNQTKTLQTVKEISSSAIIKSTLPVIAVKN